MGGRIKQDVEKPTTKRSDCQEIGKPSDRSNKRNLKTDERIEGGRETERHIEGAMERGRTVECLGDG